MTQQEFQDTVIYKIQELTTNLTDVSNNTKLIYTMMSKLSKGMDVDLDEIFEESMNKIAEDNAMLLSALKEAGYIEQVDIEKEKETVINSFKIFKDSLDNPEKFKDEYIKEIEESIKRRQEQEKQMAKQKKKPNIIRPNMNEHSKYSKKD